MISLTRLMFVCEACLRGVMSVSTPNTSVWRGGGGLEQNLMCMRNIIKTATTDTTVTYEILGFANSTWKSNTLMKVINK
jgi:hypothetical protein